MAIPKKLWCRYTDTLEEYLLAAEKWIKAGKPHEGALFQAFLKAEKAYEPVLYETTWKMSREQREEWDMKFQRFEERISQWKVNSESCAQ